MQQVGANAYAETEKRGCNFGFVTTTEGVVMIDTPQLPRDAVAWRETVAAQGPVRYIINTEPHGDHVTGNFFFEGVVIAQGGTRRALEGFSVKDLRERMALMDPESVPLLEGYELKRPAITFGNRLTLHLGQHTFELVHLPGHTASETAVHIPEERLLFTGDNIFYRTQPFFHEADPFAWLESLKKLGAYDVHIIVPGHGAVCDKQALGEMATLINDWLEAVRAAIAKGMSREDAARTISLLDRAPMGPGMEAFGPELQRMNVERLYDLLSVGR